MVDTVRELARKSEPGIADLDRLVEAMPKEEKRLFPALAAAGMPVEPPPIGSYRAGVYLTRYDDSFFLEGEGYEPLAGGRV